MGKFYTYCHRRNDTGEVFYVGKGQGQRAWDSSNRSQYWKRVAAKHGHTVEVLAENLSESEAFRQERRLIQWHTREVLCNMTDGGEGASGARVSAETRAMLSAMRKGHATSEETKAKISAKLKGRTFSPEWHEKQRIAQRGKVHSASTKAKISASSRGRTTSAETRAQQSAAKKGKPFSEEHKAALRAAWIRRKTNSVIPRD